jgi:two-component sensor histidine kinase
MKLIRLLSKQLGGTFEFRQAEGFSLSIEFDHNA